MPQVLSYFSDANLPVGALVEVPIGRRVVKSVIIRSESLEGQRITVRKSAFQLKRIRSVLSESSLVSPLQLSLASWLARSYYASLGAALKTVLPRFFGSKKYQSYPLPHVDAERAAVLPHPTIEPIATSDIPRLIRSLYDSARGQILLLVPEKAALEVYAQALNDLRPLCIHGGLRISDYASAWSATAAGNPRLIIGTRASLTFPFAKLSTIVVDDYTSETFKSDTSPKYWTPDFAREVARIHNAAIMNTGCVIRVEDTTPETMPEYATSLSEQIPASRVRLVDHVPDIRSGNHSPLTRDLQRMIIETASRGDSILLYSARRAYAGALMCSNCSSFVQCERCSLPLRVHRLGYVRTSGAPEQMLVCYHCGAYRDAPSFCTICNSASLRPTGVPGSQKIAQETQRLLDEHSIEREIMIFDSDLLRTEQHKEEALESIRAHTNPIVIGTQLLLQYRRSLSFSSIGVVSADALVRTMDFRADERFITHMAKLFEFSPHTITLQTFHPDTPVLSAISSGSFLPWYTEEYAMRKLLGYPPFRKLALLTFRHSVRVRAEHAARELAEKLRMVIHQHKQEQFVQILGPEPPLIERENNIFIFRIVLKFSSEIEHVGDILRYVPTGWIIDVDPVSIA